MPNHRLALAAAAAMFAACSTLPEVPKVQTSYPAPFGPGHETLDGWATGTWCQFDAKAAAAQPFLGWPVVVPLGR